MKVTQIIFIQPFDVFFSSDYTELASHFSEEHFLCEEGDCATAQFTNAFASEIDFKAHKATMHTKNLRKAQAKQARTLDIEYNLVPRPSQAGRRGGPRDRKQGIWGVLLLCILGHPILPSHRRIMGSCS